MIVSPNMNLAISTINVDSGLQWETNLNSSLTIIDAHNHTSGNGVSIPPAGLNINGDLTFQNNSATNLKAVVFTNQSSFGTAKSLYAIAGDLYFNDGNSNPPIQMTAGGVVNATSSGISSGTATASFSAGVLVVNSASNTPANIKGGSVLLGNIVAASKFLTLAPPSAMAADFTLTLPSQPSVTSFMTMNSSGTMGVSTALTGALTTSNLSATAGILNSQIAAVGQQVSSSSGTFTTSSLTDVVVTNLTATLTTVGKPVVIMLVPFDTSGCFIELSDGSNTLSQINATISLYVAGVSTFVSTLSDLAPSIGIFGLRLPPSSVSFFHVPAAGSHTYQIYASVSNATTALLFNKVALIAYELK